MWIKQPFFKYMTGAILIVIFVFLLGKIDFALGFLMKIIATLFFPFLIAGLLYYLLRPVVYLLSKPKYVPRPVAILIIYAAIIGAIYLIVHFAGDFFSHQISELTKTLPKDLKSLEGNTKQFINENNIDMFSFAEIKHKLMGYLGNIMHGISQNIMGIIAAITSIATVLIIVPFVLFYLLKDDIRLAPFLLKFLPAHHAEEGSKILKDIDRTLSAYILGQATVAVVDGVLMYIGYLIIGLDYAIFLALFVILTAVIPLLGPILGVLPAIILASMQDPILIIYILILLLVVQQLEGNLVSPFILGKRLNLHPLTILLLLLVAGALYGFIGILIAVPLYSILKVTVTNFYRFYRLRKKEN
jgi:predicted PurR-regulated permease PerM